MIIPDLTKKEKARVKEICQSVPELLKEYWNTSELPKFRDLQIRTSKEFLRYKRCGHTLDYFYENCETFLPELAIYSSNAGRIQSVCKRLRILKHFQARKVVDFGSGVGTDGLAYADFGIRTIQVEHRNRSRKFAKWIAKRNGVSEKMSFVSPSRFVTRLATGNKNPYDAIQAIEVVAHVEQPYYLFSTFMKNSKLMMWTNDIGLHRDGIEDPQHLPHSLKEVISSLDKYGSKLKIEGMAIPPRVWLRDK